MSVHNELNDLIRAGDYDAALSVLHRESSRPRDPDSLVEEGNIYLRKGDYGNASARFEEALRMNSENKDALGGSALCALYSGRTGEVQSLMNRIGNMQSVNCSLARAAQLRNTGDFGSQAQELEKARVSFPDSDIILLELIRAEVSGYMGVNTEAEKLLKEYESTWGMNPVFAEQKIRYLYNAEKERECTSFCKKVIRLFPNDSVSDTARKYLRKLKEKNSQNERRQVHRENDESTQPHVTKAEDADEAFRELNELIGLKSVKDEVNKIGKRIKFDRLRNEKLGLEQTTSDDNYHFVFTGNPGTGKTTVARLMGRIFKSFGILKEGQLVEVSRSDLVGQYLGSTSANTQKAIKDALGGVLFVDEAYSLHTDDNDSFGLEAIDALVKGMEDHRSEMVVILAGYDREMTDFLRSNSGLESRFKKIIHFPDYTDEELLQIGEYFAGKQKYHFTKEGEAAFIQAINRKKVDAKFGNARAVRGLINEAIEEKAVRYDPDRDGDEYLVTLEPKDFGIDILQTPESRVQTLLAQLNALTGLRSVKHEVEVLLSVVNYQNESRKRGEKTGSALPYNMNMFFLGSPGTGKTTVAKIYAEILAAMGVLKKGQLIPATRSDLVGQWQGTTALKTRELCEKAYGGVLFIDEAYSLYGGPYDDFGKEAIAELIKQMEDNRDKLVVIMAGYTKEMNEFRSANSGIASRISKSIEFPDYSSAELLEIVQKMLSTDQDHPMMPADDAARAQLQTTVQGIYDRRTENFGNARVMRNLSEAVFTNAALRIQKEKITDQRRYQYTAEDISNAELELEKSESL